MNCAARCLRQMLLRAAPALVACTLAAPGLPARAALVTITFDGNIFAGTEAPGHDAVAITFPQVNAGGVTTLNVAAGRFQGRASNLVGIDASVFVDNLDDVWMYCYDLYESVWGGRTVTYTVQLDGETARTLDFLGAVNAVLNAQRGTQDTYAWLHPATAAQAAAIQIGLWESRYESDVAWGIHQGSFSASGLESATLQQLNRFFDAVPQTQALDGRYAMVLSAAGAQDVITGDPPPAVPLPGTAVLAGAGLLAALGWGRCKRRAERVLRTR